MAVYVSKTKYILFRPKGQKINHNLEENGVLYNSNEIGGLVDLKSLNWGISIMTILIRVRGLTNFLEYTWMNTCLLTPTVH